MRLKILALTLPLIIASTFVHAAGLTVTFRDTVKPDAELESFLAELERLNVAPAKLDYTAIDVMFAPRIKAFTRGLDPLQPWHRVDDIAADHLGAAADIIVEQGEFAEGAKIPDYRPDALATIIEQVTRGDPFGTLKQAPGSICAPADYKVNREAAVKFVGKFELDVYSLRFFKQDLVLRQKPDDASAIIDRVPPLTLGMYDYDPKAADSWRRYESSDGVRGYTRGEGDGFGLAQHHVCFGKIKGKYRITALFGYGL